MAPKRELTEREKEIFKLWIPGDILNRARIREKAPWFLPKSFWGITLYNVIYLREYDPENIQSLSALGHELTHVRQYAEGMTIFSYLLSCKSGYLKSAYELEAYEIQRNIREFLGRNTSGPA